MTSIPLPGQRVSGIYSGGGINERELDHISEMHLKISGRFSWTRPLNSSFLVADVSSLVVKMFEPIFGLQIF